MRNIYLFVVIILLAACGKSTPKPDPAPVLPPEATVLLSPLKDEACLSGTNITPKESTITFSWMPSKNTDSYTVSIKNLITGTTATHNATTPTFQVALAHNTPYSWSVISRSNKIGDTKTSETWKFYNSGPGIVNYAPFPAEITSPLPNMSISAVGGSVVLRWKGSDVDNDIVNYDVYFGASGSPITTAFKSKYPESFCSVEVNSGKYHWRVVTRDANGNTSDSGVQDFTVN